MSNNNPIGVFDSGIGGLSVLYELKKNMPNERFIYFGDTKRVPYGDKTPNEIISNSKEIVSFLKSQNIKICVIACNTVCSTALNELEECFDLKFFSVVRSGIKSVRNKNLKTICIVGTNRTIESNVYSQGIKEFNKDSKIFSVPTPKFVGIVENGLTNTEKAKNAVNEYLNYLKKEKLEAVVLGCTHYPFLSDDIQKEFEGVELINPAKQMAEDVKKYLKENNLDSMEVDNQSISFFVTGDENKFDEMKNKYFEEFKPYKCRKHDLI